MLNFIHKRILDLFGSNSAIQVVSWRPNSFPLQAVGESHYQDALISICGAYTRHGLDREYIAIVKTEPKNPHDPNAVAVNINGHKVGYLPRPQAERVSVQFKEHGISVAQCAARVRGGWRTNQYDEGFYGVSLAIPTMGEIKFVVDE